MIYSLPSFIIKCNFWSDGSKYKKAPHFPSLWNPYPALFGDPAGNDAIKLALPYA